MTAGWWCGSPEARSCALVDRLGGVDVLVHEGGQALLEIGTALARLEVHRVLLGGGNGLRIIPDEPTRRQLPRGRGGLRRARRRQAPGDGQGAVDLRRCSPPAAVAPSTTRAGEPAFVFELGGQTFAFVVEGLGTKSIIARQRARGPGRSTASPTSPTTPSRRSSTTSAASVRCRSSSTPTSRPAPRSGTRSAERSAALLEGWRRACVDAGCVWGGGESPSLPGLLDEREIELAGAAVGAVPDGRARSSASAWTPGDEIVLVASSGLHANGASLARLIAARLPRGLRDRAARRRELRRGAARAVGDVRAAARRAARRDGVRPHLHQPRHGPRTAQADAPHAAAHLPHRAPARGARRARLPRRARPVWMPRPRTHVQHGLGLRAVLPRRAQARRSSRVADGPGTGARSSPGTSRRDRGRSCSSRSA